MLKQTLLCKLWEDKMRRNFFLTRGLVKGFMGERPFQLDFDRWIRYQYIGVWASWAKGIANRSGCWSVACVFVGCGGENI